MLSQLSKSHLNDMPYIYPLIAQGNLQTSERLQKALKSNDSTTECRCLLSRESLLIIEGALMRRLAYTIKRKNMHTSRISKVSKGHPSHSQLEHQAHHSPDK